MVAVFAAAAAAVPGIAEWVVGLYLTMQTGWWATPLGSQSSSQLAWWACHSPFGSLMGKARGLYNVGQLVDLVVVMKNRSSELNKLVPGSHHTC